MFKVDFWDRRLRFAGIAGAGGRDKRGGDTPGDKHGTWRDDSVTKQSHNSRERWQCRDSLPNPGRRRGRSPCSPGVRVRVSASTSCPSSAAQSPSVVPRDTDTVPLELRWDGEGGKKGRKALREEKADGKKTGEKKKTNRTTPYWLETATSGSGVTSLGATGTGGGSASSEQQAVVTHCTGGHGEAAPAGMDPPGGARRSQPVHPERVLCGGVGEDHVGVVEHVQSIQGQRVNFEFIQRELGIRVEADVPHPCQGAGQFFG